VAFSIHEYGKKPPPRFKMMNCRMIFDIKLDALVGNQNWCFKGKFKHCFPDRYAVRPASSQWCADCILMVLCAEQIYAPFGVEFGPDAGKTAIIVHTLDGL